MVYCFNMSALISSSINEDTIVEWVNIVQGTDNYNKADSEALFKLTSAFLIANDDKIAYFDGVQIKTITINSGQITPIANATSFKGWNIE